MPDSNQTSDFSATEVPAIFINRYQVLISGQNIRVAFAEGFEDESNKYRTAIVLSSQDALDLVTTLLTAIQKLTPAPLMPSQGLGIFGGSAPNPSIFVGSDNPLLPRKP